MIQDSDRIKVIARPPERPLFRITNPLFIKGAENGDRGRRWSDLATKPAVRDGLAGPAAVERSVYLSLMLLAYLWCSLPATTAVRSGEAGVGSRSSCADDGEKEVVPGAVGGGLPPGWSSSKPVPDPAVFTREGSGGRARRRYFGRSGGESGRVAGSGTSSSMDLHRSPLR